MAIKPGSRTASGVHPGAGRVLVIDDSNSVLDAIEVALKEVGFSVVTTTQTVGAARHLGSCDLVILDFHMPGFDGASVLRSLKSAAEQCQARCLFLLYTSDEAEARRFKSHGFDAPLMKKGDMPALVSQVQALMRMLRTRAGATEKHL